MHKQRSTLVTTAIRSLPPVTLCLGNECSPMAREQHHGRMPQLEIVDHFSGQTRGRGARQGRAEMSTLGVRLGDAATAFQQQPSKRGHRSCLACFH